jgi:gamma-glutamyltranspeptidase / glutathione hydrolase
MIDLSPNQWPAEERAEWLHRTSALNTATSIATGTQGAVTGAFGAFASRVALAALQQGGSSMDAALAAALAQVVLMGGGSVSLFGILGLVHYDAASGETHTLNAGWQTCRDEREPLTIPQATPSGRSALVSTFMRGFDEAHRRFGKLPYASLYAPAHWLASEGFPFHKILQGMLAMRRDDLARLPATRAVFTRPDGNWYQEGDTFRQPALAATLEQLAAHGAAYFYDGPWAEKCVAAIRADGGTMTAEDLASCAPIWSPPVRAEVAGARLALLGEPCVGSAALIEALLVAEAADIPKLGHWSRNAESFRRLVETTNLLGLMFAPQLADALFPGIERTTAARLRRDTAAKLWQKMQAGTQVLPPIRKGSHSDNIVVTDRWGNMTTICQSINCVVWGKTAIMVDGVSIGDPAAAQQPQVAAAGPGGHVPMPIEIGIVERDRKRLAFASMNAGAHHKSVAALLNLLHFGMDPQQAAAAPALLLPEVLLPDLRTRVQVAEGDFDPKLLDESGLDVRVLPRAQAAAAAGIWVAVERDADRGTVSAVAPNYGNGAAAAY